MTELKKPYWEALIHLVRSREAIWNDGSKEYKDRGLVAKDWDSVMLELAKIVPKNDHGFTVNSLKERWGALRATCRRNKNKVKPTKDAPGAGRVKKIKWPYFKQMTFLDAARADATTTGSLESTLPQVVVTAAAPACDATAASTTDAAVAREDVCDDYAKVFGSELRHRISEDRQPLVFRRVLQLIDACAEEFKQ